MRNNLPQIQEADLLVREIGPHARIEKVVLVRRGWGKVFERPMPEPMRAKILKESRWGFLALGKGSVQRLIRHLTGSFARRIAWNLPDVPRMAVAVHAHCNEFILCSRTQLVADKIPRYILRANNVPHGSVVQTYLTLKRER